eukprot:TRINITY_DN56751_c0_g1_i1.p1 TRINITY_DN56751_c0_g1~~TRINITY_DN56751_c0_g1_i1.p1  ORF type:complete len:335 (+),score=81.33 TRINITY_DN56751_c0_g1_i1:99-1007(+)
MTAEPQVVLDLKAFDDKYLELEKEYRKKVQDLASKYTAKQQPLLAERTQILTNSGDSNDNSVPGMLAIEKFWVTALLNHPDLEDQIQEWDLPVLEHLIDITKDHLDKDDSTKGFKLTFQFSENPYFEHRELSKEYHTEEESPYTADINAEEVKATQIVWKPGKDVTMEKVKKKKAKGGGAKKGNQTTTKEEERPSFFRTFFRNMKSDDDLPEDVHLLHVDMEDSDDDDDDNDMVMPMILQADHEIGIAIRDFVIPYATRWYTGEAVPEAEDSDSDDIVEGEESDETDSESDVSPKNKSKQKK